MGTTQGGPSSSVVGTATPTPTPTSPVAVGLAGGYSRDVGIERDPDVIFTEMAEEPSLGALFSNWDGDSTSNSVALDRSSVPPLSAGQQSIRLFTTSAPNGAGGVRSAGLYKFFPEGYEGTLYARWYVKYNTVGTFHHSGPRLGGNNPGSPSQPTSPAGVRPNGSDFFYLGAELSGAKAAPSPRSTVDFYNYWMHQRGSSFFPGQYFGNSFINDPSVSVDLNAWNCIEVRLTLNSPVDTFSGEAAMWVNGRQVAVIAPGTLGFWTEDKFRPDPTGQPFEGFQWRNDGRLKINYFQLLHFVDQDPPGVVNSIYFDHVVIARRYIGPMT